MLHSGTIKEVEKIIRNFIQKKMDEIDSVHNKSSVHDKLIGNNFIALSKFINSLNSNILTGEFEKIAFVIAKERFEDCELGFIPNTKISKLAQQEIQKIIYDLDQGKESNKKEEIEKIRQVANIDDLVNISSKRVSLKLTSNNNKIHLFSLTSAELFKKNNKEFKQTLLEWVGIILSSDINADINTMIAVPFNPFGSTPYNYKIPHGHLDVFNELTVAERFWNFIGGDGTFQELSNCLERIKIDIQHKINEKFGIGNRIRSWKFNPGESREKVRELFNLFNSKSVYIEISDPWTGARPKNRNALFQLLQQILDQIDEIKKLRISLSTNRNYSDTPDTQLKKLHELINKAGVLIKPEIVKKNENSKAFHDRTIKIINTNRNNPISALYYITSGIDVHRQNSLQFIDKIVCIFAADV